MDHPAIADFAAGLELINGLADKSPGFVWRLQTDSGDLTSVRPYEDPDVIVNLTVWETPEALREFAYRSDHLSFLRRRGDWFIPMDGEVVVGWWVPAGHLPDIDEAKARLAHLIEHGPTAHAFGIRKPFPPT